MLVKSGSYRDLLRPYRWQSSLLLLLQRLAEESGHPELAEAPLLFWGHSGGGDFGATFAETHSQRTIGFVDYHTYVYGRHDVKGLSQIPVLLFAGGKDSTIPQKDIQDSWARGRQVGAPWTFAIDPDATHSSGLEKADDLMISWITAVIRQRLSPTGTTLRPLMEGSAWMGNHQTSEIAPYNTFSGSKPELSWLPDEASAQGWRKVQGATN